MAPDGGVVRAVSRRDGTVLVLMVAEGDVVEAGAPLARVGMTAQFSSDGLAFDRSQSTQGTYADSPVEDVATGTVFADTQAMTPEAAVQALVVTAAHALLRDIAELPQHGSNGLSHEILEWDGDHIVTAPISGRVDALLARQGHHISRGNTLALVAASDELIAEIAVPLHAAGLVTSGQGLRLKYEGLPFGHQGVQQGIVTQMSSTPLATDDIEHVGIPVTGPVYRAQVRLPAQEIDVDGMIVDLRAGMRLTAEIPAPRRTVFQTLYDTIR